MKETVAKINKTKKCFVFFFEMMNTISQTHREKKKNREDSDQ